LKEIPGCIYSDLSEKLLTAAWSIKESLFKWQAGSEIDFVKHLQIIKIHINENQGIAECKIVKEEEINLDVHLLFFNNNCISWVLTNVF
jgi:hypothetical protein